MAVNWWRGIRRVYVVISIVWLLGFAVMAWIGWDEMTQPLRDERALASLAGCAPARGNTKGLFSDVEYTAMSEERKLRILAHLCPRTSELYQELSPWGQEQLLQGVGISPIVTISGATPARRVTGQRLGALAGFAVGPPALLYVALLAGRWALNGFRPRVA